MGDESSLFDALNSTFELNRCTSGHPLALRELAARFSLRVQKMSPFPRSDPDGRRGTFDCTFLI